MGEKRKAQEKKKEKKRRKKRKKQVKTMARFASVHHHMWRTQAALTNFLVVYKVNASNLTNNHLDWSTNKTHQPVYTLHSMYSAGQNKRYFYRPCVLCTMVGSKYKRLNTLPYCQLRQSLRSFSYDNSTQCQFCV